MLRARNEAAENHGFQRNMESMRKVACQYFRNSGRSCRECSFCGTKSCAYAGRLLNEGLLRSNSMI